MPFEAGNTLGAKSAPSRGFTRALRIAVSKAHEGGGNRLRALADSLVSKAESGDVAAIREIADRLDGKPASIIRLQLQRKLSTMNAAEAMNAIADAVAEGEIAVDDGRHLSALIESRMRAVEINEIEQRLAALEAVKP